MATSNIQSLRRAAVAGIIGAAMTAIGGVAAQLARGSTTVSDQIYHYPWSHDGFVAFSVFAAVTHVLIFVMLLGFLRSGLAGTTRAANTGLMLALLGTALLFVAELASIPIADRSESDAAAAIVDSVFGIATILTAIGLLLAGKATLQAGLWRDWRRFTPLLCGIWAVVLTAVAFTSLISLGVGIYGLCFLGLGIALYTRPAPVLAAPGTTSAQPVSVGS